MEVIEIPIYFDVVKIPFPKRVRKVNQVTAFVGDHVFRVRGGSPDKCVKNLLDLLDTANFTERVVMVVKQAIMDAVRDYMIEWQK